MEVTVAPSICSEHVATLRPRAFASNLTPLAHEEAEESSSRVSKNKIIQTFTACLCRSLCRWLLPGDLQETLDALLDVAHTSLSDLVTTKTCHKQRVQQRLRGAAFVASVASCCWPCMNFPITTVVPSPLDLKHSLRDQHTHTDTHHF